LAHKATFRWPFELADPKRDLHRWRGKGVIVEVFASRQPAVKADSSGSAKG
jgi:hypothetical protein